MKLDGYSDFGGSKVVTFYNFRVLILIDVSFCNFSKRVTLISRNFCIFFPDEGGSAQCGNCGDFWQKFRESNSFTKEITK